MNGTRSEQLNEYTHFFNGVDKVNRAIPMVSLHIKNELARSIKDWDAFNECILRVELKLKCYEVVIIAVYSPSYDAMVANKDNR